MTNNLKNQTMKLRKIYEAADGTTIEFRRIKNVPAWSHRVIINGTACDWLSNNFKPNSKTAQFYYEKHSPRKEGS